MKVCVSIAEETTAAVLARMEEQLPDADLFELRADFVRDLDLPALLAARSRPLLLTCRPEAEGGRWPDGDPDGRRQVLARAVELGFDMVDVEARSGFDEIVAAKAGRGLVLSWHDFAGTPDGLDTIYERMAAVKPDVVKIAVRARSVSDLGRLLAFARRRAPGPGRPGPALLALAMGPEGVASRVLGGRYGAPFTFAAPASDRATAPGQLPARVLASTYRVGAIGPATRVYGVLGRDVLRSLSPAIHNRAFAALRRGRRLRPAPVRVARRLPARAAGARPRGVQRDAALQAGDPAAPRVRLARGGARGLRQYGHGQGRRAVRDEHRRRRRARPAAPEARPGRAHGRDPRRGRRGAGRGLRPDRRRLPGAPGLASAGAGGGAGGRHRRAGAALARGPGVGRLGRAAQRDAGRLGGAARRAPGVARALRPGAVVFDMVYEPRETPLLAAARERGCVAIDGVEMLVAQAVGQLEAWLGSAPPQDVLTRAALEAIEEARA